ncbi:hypothetical protein KR200_002156 [Drosophila serrata]|nr:hypothetical protein KR200_002156 [Drosophila serrata]
MSDAPMCTLCRENLAIEVDLEKPMYKAVNKLLQRLFECYKIDISILGESSCICQACFERVLHISESLKKWTKTHEALQETPLEIDDSKAFQIKLEAPSSASEDEEMESPQNNDMDIPEDKSDEETEETPQNEGQEVEPEFFCVAIGQDGMVIAKLFKDSTKAIKLMCTCCDKAYDNMMQIRSHNPMTRKTPTYYCGTCGANFQKPKQLADHEEAEDHKKPSTRHRDIDFRCLKCDEMFIRFTDTIRHENSTHSFVEHTCPSCNMHFKYYGSFQKHLRFHNPVDPPPDVYDCNYPNCTRRFRVWKRYVKHTNWHQSQCQKCPYVGCNISSIPGNYMRHMRAHLKQAQYKHEGKFMKLDPVLRVHPDVRKVPYAKRTLQGQKEEQPVERIKVNPDGEFISLPKQIIYRKGRYVNVPEKK